MTRSKIHAIKKMTVEWPVCFKLSGLHRCRWRMLETFSVGDKSKMAGTDLRILYSIVYVKKVTDI